MVKLIALTSVTVRKNSPRKRSRVLSQEREAFFRAMVGSKGYKEKTLSEEETNAVVSFLCLHVDPFRDITDLTVLDGRPQS